MSEHSVPPQHDSKLSGMEDEKELIIYQVEEEVRQKLISWFKRQISIFVILANAVVIFGGGALAFSIIRSSIDSAVNGAVDRSVAAESARIDAAIGIYQSLVNDAVKNLRENQEDIIKLEFDLERAIKNAEEAASEVNSRNTALANSYERLSLDMSKTRDQYRAAAEQVTRKYETLVQNQKKWGDSIYERSAVAVKILSNHLAELKALQRMAVDNYGRTQVMSTVAQEKQSLQKNGNTSVLLYVQSGIDRSKIKESQWVLDLQLRGFNVDLLYSGNRSYSDSRSLLQSDTNGLEDHVTIDDQCTIVHSKGYRNSYFLDHVRKQYEEIGIPTNCIKFASWELESEVKNNNNLDNFENKENRVISYFLMP